MKDLLLEFEDKQKGSNKIFTVISILFISLTIFMTSRYYYPYSQERVSQSFRYPKIISTFITQFLPIIMGIIFLSKKKIAWSFLTIWSLCLGIAFALYSIQNSLRYLKTNNIFDLLFRIENLFVLSFTILIILLFNRSLLKHLDISKKRLLITISTSALLILAGFTSKF